MTALLLPVMECKKMIFWFLEQAKNRNFYCSTIEHNGDAIEIKRKLQSDWIFDWTMCTHSDSLYCAALPHIQKQNSFSICFPFDYWLLRHYFLFFFFHKTNNNWKQTQWILQQFEILIIIVPIFKKNYQFSTPFRLFMSVKLTKKRTNGPILHSSIECCTHSYPNQAFLGKCDFYNAECTIPIE